MNNEQPTMMNCAMNFGVVVGVYYIVKFSLFPLSLHSTMAALLFLGLTLVVPVLVYRLVKRYRNQYCGGQIDFFRAFSFTMLTMGCGSLLAAVAHYAYFAFIDGGAMVGALVQSIEQLKGVDLTVLENASAESIVQLNQYIEFMQHTVDQIRAMSPIDITIGMLSNNVSWSVVLSLPVALIVSARRQEKIYKT